MRDKSKEKKMRECRKCDKPFMSEGYENRICETCNLTNRNMLYEVEGDGCSRINHYDPALVVRAVGVKAI